MAVGAGGAFTVGENGLGPESMRGAFSVGGPGSPGAGGGGLSGGAVVVVVVVVVVVSSGVDSSSAAHDAVNSTVAAMAAPPATEAIRHPKRPGLIV